MAQHSNYWSCSKFADWVRGTEKPMALELGAWDNWNKTASNKHPIRYWIADEGLDYVQDFITWPVRKIYDFKYYINNRLVTRTHSLTAHPRDIRPGSWCDVGNRFLPCMFNELVDFVEIEQAWSHIAWGSEEDRAKYKAPFWATGWFRWRTWRCPEAGLDHLNWAMTLVMDDNMGVEKNSPNYGKPTGQAERAREIKELYTWWTVTRPARPDPYKASGWMDHCDAMSAKYGPGMASWGKEDKKDKAASTKARKLLDKMEADYEKEDEAMMIQLIKVRHGLWT
jgi:hypothetical protein